MAGENGGKRRSGNSGMYTAVAVATVLLTVLMGVSIFFKVNEVTVEGNVRYTAEEIIEASGIELGDSIFLLRGSRTALKIRRELPYADEIQIRFKYPDKVIVQLTESVPLAAAEFEGAWWLMDKKARVLEKTDASGAADAITLQGMELDQVAVGRTLTLKETGTVKLRCLQDVLTALQDAGIYESVTTLDMTNISKIRFGYKKHTVVLGRDEKLDIKMAILLAFFEKCGDEGTGILDISSAEELKNVPPKDV